ncbi:hypothetical protein D3C72_1694410 [compost metagenome]
MTQLRLQLPQQLAQLVRGFAGTQPRLQLETAVLLVHLQDVVNTQVLERAADIRHQPQPRDDGFIDHVQLGIGRPQGIQAHHAGHQRRQQGQNGKTQQLQFDGHRHTPEEGSSRLTSWALRLLDFLSLRAGDRLRAARMVVRHGVRRPSPLLARMTYSRWCPASALIHI